MLNRSDLRIVNATLVLPDCLIPGGVIHVQGGRITAIGSQPNLFDFAAPTFDARACSSHPASSTCTSTAAAGPTSWTRPRTLRNGLPRPRPPRHDIDRADQHRRPARTNAALPRAVRPVKRAAPTRGRTSRILGAHLYGPYFAQDKVGCHPRPPHARQRPTNSDSTSSSPPDTLLVATCAPELAGDAEFYAAAAARGVRLNAGHSNATLGRDARRLRPGRAARRSLLLRDEQLRLDPHPLRHARCAAG